MDHAYASNTSATPPDPALAPLHGFPQSGVAGTAQQATALGPYWPYMITEELRNLILAAGLVPASNVLNQVLLSLRAMFAPNGRPGRVYTDNDWTPLGGGIVLQWGKGNYANAATITLPVAYATSHILTIAAMDGEAAGSNIELAATSALGLGSFKIYPVTNPVTGGSWSPVTAPCWWLSLGR